MPALCYCELDQDTNPTHHRFAPPSSVSNPTGRTRTIELSATDYHLVGGPPDIPQRKREQWDKKATSSRPPGTPGKHQPMGGRKICRPTTHAHTQSGKPKPPELYFSSLPSVPKPFPDYLPNLRNAQLAAPPVAHTSL